MGLSAALSEGQRGKLTEPLPSALLPDGSVKTGEDMEPSETQAAPNICE